jgi:hypothetical protein
VNVEYSLLGISLASEFYKLTFRNSVSVPSSWVSRNDAYHQAKPNKIRTPRKFPEDSILQTGHTLLYRSSVDVWVYPGEGNTHTVTLKPKQIYTRPMRVEIENVFSYNVFWAMSTCFSCICRHLVYTQTVISVLLMRASNAAIVKYDDVRSCERLSALFVSVFCITSLKVKSVNRKENWLS